MSRSWYDANDDELWNLGRDLVTDFNRKVKFLIDNRDKIDEVEKKILSYNRKVTILAEILRRFRDLTNKQTKVR